MVRLMRKLFTGLLTLSLSLILLGLILYNEQSIVQYLNETVLHSYEKIVVHKNEYYRPNNFMFVQNTENHLVSSKQEIYNNFYSGINSGEDSFSFYCKHDYEECLDDLTEIASNRDLLSHINNFTHPFNSFKQVETKFEAFGKVTIMLKKNYTKEERDKLNAEVERLSKELFSENNTIKYNILQAHNYIINKSKYDSNKISGTSIYNSDKATGPLFEGYAICSGYTDSMQLFLEELGINNYRVASDKHTWNAVEIENKWYHLDLTWDDPVAVGLPDLDLLEHEFFLISTRDLINFNTGEHSFDQDIYKELKIEA